MQNFNNYFSYIQSYIAFEFGTKSHDKTTHRQGSDQTIFDFSSWKVEIQLKTEQYHKYLQALLNDKNLLFYITSYSELEQSLIDSRQQPIHKQECIDSEEEFFIILTLKQQCIVLFNRFRFRVLHIIIIIKHLQTHSAYSSFLQVIFIVGSRGEDETFNDYFLRARDRDMLVSWTAKLMQITPELIQKSPQFTNPDKQKQLDLRGYNLTEIENTGATLNFFECIDLSDNEIKRLENFSYLDRLNTLILTNNRIKTIHGIAECLPNLENLFLMNNKISDLREVAKLGKCRKLQRLVLINNSVTQQLNYRPFVISRIPSLKILDFNVVTAKERRQAEVQLGQQQHPVFGKW